MVDLIDVTTSRTVKIIIKIFNALNLSARALLRGRTIVTSIYFPFRILKPNQKMFMPKSFTLIYEHNSMPTRNRHVQFGERQTGDRLLHFESKEITSTLSNRLTATDFVYDNSQQSITSFEFSFDVCLLLEKLAIQAFT